MIEWIEQWTYLAVFIIAATPWLEMFAVIPLGIVYGLNPWLVIIFSFLGNWFTVMLLIIFYDRFLQWRKRRKKTDKVEQESKRSIRAKKIWERYGLPGLTIVSPLLIGTHLAALVAMGLKTSKINAMIWMTVSLIIWTVIITVTVYYGFDLSENERPTIL